MAGGRPPKWTDPKVIEEIGMAFFALCEEMKRPKTITGLALALDTTRETLMDYQEKDEFSDTIKRLKLFCENFAEEQAFAGKNQAGAIFALKNYGWHDKQEHDHTTLGEKITRDFVGSPEAEALRLEYEAKLKDSLK